MSNYCKWFNSLFLEGGPVDIELKNKTNSCLEIKRVVPFKNCLPFTGPGAY